MFQLFSFDFVFVHREVAPVGPPFFEWLISRIFRKRIIYDFDDAIWLTDRLHEPWLLSLAKWRAKVGEICRWSYKISCGNSFLQQYALAFNPSAFVIPTTVDTNEHHAPLNHPPRQNGNVTIGWTGSHSTLKYLLTLENVLAKIEERFPAVRIIVIADKDPNLNLKHSVFLPWRKDTEIQDLDTIDIGIMPLPDSPWTQGKCGFKAIQYMALGKPCVISPVGVNTMIVDDGVNGFLAANEEDWIHSLSVLISSRELREQMGHRAREKIVQGFSVTSNRSSFLSLFE